MITIEIDNKNNMDASEFDRLCQCLAILNRTFDVKVRMDEIKITGRLDFLSVNGQKYYKSLIKKKCVNNLRVLRG